MIGLRVGAVLAARKRGYGSRPFDPDEDLKKNSEYTHEGIKDYDIKENKKNFLKLRKKPYLEWGVGIVLIAAAIFAEWFLITGHTEIGIDDWAHNWTQVFLMLGLIAAGVWCIAEGEIEVLTFDKAADSMMITYT